MPRKTTRMPMSTGSMSKRSRAGARTRASSATQTDSKFKYLPLELRMMIWEATLTDAQVHHVSTRAVPVEGRAFRRVPRIIPASLPVAFQVCHESRRIARARLKRFAIHPLRTPVDLNNSRTPYGYFDPEVDYIHFGGVFNVAFIPISEPFHNISILFDITSRLAGAYDTIAALSTRAQPPPHICLVVPEKVTLPSRHDCGRANVPLAVPDLSVSPGAEGALNNLVAGWVSEVESHVEAARRPLITVGHIPFACDCEGMVKEMQACLAARKIKEAESDRKNWIRGERLRKRLAEKEVLKKQEKGQE